MDLFIWTIGAMVVALITMAIAITLFLVSILLCIHFFRMIRNHSTHKFLYIKLKDKNRNIDEMRDILENFEYKVKKIRPFCSYIEIYKLKERGVDYEEINKTRSHPKT